MLVLINASYTDGVESYCKFSKIRYIKTKNSSGWITFEIFNNTQVFISNFLDKLNLRKEYKPNRDWLTIEDGLDDLFVMKMNSS